MQYVLSTGADLDLEAIWDYIALDSITAADRWLDKLYEAFEAIATNPGMGHKHHAVPDAVRVWPVNSYVIIYRSINKNVEIVAVTEGSRDIPSFLARRKK